VIRAVIAIACCLALVGLWWHGYKKGERTDKQRSDLVISKMVSDAQARLAAANETVRLQSASLQATKERAERDLQSEKARNERRLADARATSDLVRDTIAEFARGQQSGDDTAASISERAAELGRLLGESVQLQTELAGAAEDHAASVRALLNAWPTKKGTP
jgi:hypothetical protein